MKKLLIAYSVVLIILIPSFFLFKRTFKEWLRHSELTNRANKVLRTFQELSGQINNAAVLNPNLIAATRSSSELNIFLIDSLSILQTLNKLKSTVRDSTNIRIVNVLEPKIKSELGWIIKSNVPDSMIYHKATEHILELEIINSLIKQGQQRTKFVLQTHEDTMDKGLSRVIAWMSVFMTSILAALIYTIVSLLKQHAKTKEKDAQLITDRNNSKRKLAKVNRLYSFLSAINQSIVHVNDQNELLDQVCRVATEAGQFKLAYVGLLDSEHRLNIASLSGDKQGAEKILKMEGLDVNDPAYKNVPTIQVLKTGKYNYHNDMQNDPVFAQWKNDFVLHGIHASISLPIFKFGKAIGILGLHAGSPGFFDTEEIALLVEAAGDISFALENFEKAQVHKETEEQLLKNEKRFRGMIEKSADFKTLTDKTGRLTYGSPSVLAFFGYTLAEFLGKEAMSFFHPDDVSDLINRRNEILNKPGAFYKFQYRIGHKNGNWIWCEGTATNFLQEPAIQAMVTNFRDISENRKNAMEKEKLIKHLTLNNQDLRQFAYITSHNLRGPIANLLGLTSLLDTIKIKDPTLSRILTGIKAATAMFDETIKDLATVLTLRDNPDIQLENIDFEVILEKVKDFCESSLADCQGEIVSDFNKSPKVSFNKSYLESIFMNLLTNAIKYKDDSRRLKIQIKTYLQNDQIVLKFSDNGMGFDSEMQKEKVFKLYQRFHVHKEGKGLGLFLIKSQLDALGGAIEVESKIGTGTSFTIKFNKEYKT